MTDHRLANPRANATSADRAWTAHRPGGLMRYVGALCIVAVSTLVAELLYRAFDITRLSMVFLAAVLVTAIQFGRGPALLSAVAAFFVYNFYLVEPRFTVQLASADDYLTLGLFFAVALGTGSLAGRVSDEVIQRRARERTLSTLFEASSSMSATENEQVLRERIAEAVASAAQGCAFVFDDEAEEAAPAFCGGDPDAAQVASRLKAGMKDLGLGTTVLEDWRARPLHADERVWGVVVWRPAEARGRASDASGLVDVLVDLGAAAIARARLSAVKAEVEAVAQAERLRIALLSSISHDFRTPLATIMASATSLLDYDDQLGPEVRRDLLQNVQEETERLNRFVANLLNMTRLESGVLEVRTEPVRVREIVDRVLHRLEKRSAGRRLTAMITDRDLQVEADPVLLEQVLTNIAENAVAYSPPESEVTVWADTTVTDVVIDISDEGEGVSPKDQTRIFDKFYRLGQQRAPHGAGLGLSIARGLVEAMGGDIRAEARNDGRNGLSLKVTLPRAAA